MHELAKAIVQNLAGSGFKNVKFLNLRSGFISIKMSIDSTVLSYEILDHISTMAGRKVKSWYTKSQSSSSGGMFSPEEWNHTIFLYFALNEE